MVKDISVERQLIMAANASDLSSIVRIVNNLRAGEKESISTNVFDTALGSIARYAEVDRAESAYAMLMFVRSVGHYTSPSVLASTLQLMPQSLPLSLSAAQMEKHSQAESHQRKILLFQ